MNLTKMLTGVAAALALLAATGAPAAAARTDWSSVSLYHGPGPRPGPPLLYETPVVAPELTNAPGSAWKAQPILVSGTSAYRQGEFLWQSWLFDDHGAAGHWGDYGTDNSNPFSWATGTYQYPTGAAYADDAADLVEFRVKPLANATAFRLTFNSMKDPALVGTTIALGGTAGIKVSWPYGANVTSPAAYFMTVHGSQADLRRADGSVIDAHLPVAIDMYRRQVQVEIPHSDWNPGHRTVRMAGGVGLWDQSSDRYVIPTGWEPTATMPAGAGTLVHPPAFFKLLFRYEHSTDPATGQPAANQEPEPTLAATGSVYHPAWWRESAQATALASGDISGFYTMVSFAKLDAGVTDNMYNQSEGIPTFGPMDRIVSSHVETEQGRDFSTSCASETSCQGELRSQLQPYAIYIPRGPTPKGGYGLTLLLHSLTDAYNQFLGSKNQSEFANRAHPSIVITPEGRGPDGWYYDEAGADTFEVWADVAARYHLDPSYTDIAGYSMGGYGTYKFAAQFPDLFAAAQPTVGPPDLEAYDPTSDPGNVIPMLDSLRNIPILIYNATTDELVPFVNAQDVADTFDSLGYRYTFDAFAPAEHLTLATNDSWQPAANFLGNKRIDFNPPHVTYTYNPSMDFAADGTKAGHAYWVSAVGVRDKAANYGEATVDVLSHGFGVGDPTPSPTERGVGVLKGGRIPAIAYESQWRTWGPAPRVPGADELDVKATNASALTIDPERARVNCSARVTVTTDGPVSITLSGCWTRRFS